MTPPSWSGSGRQGQWHLPAEPASGQEEASSRGPWKCPPLRGSAHAYTQPRRCRPHSLSGRHSATCQARTGLRRHRTTARSHREAPRGHSPEGTVTPSLTPALRAQDGGLGGRTSLAYKTTLESLLQQGQRKPQDSEKRFQQPELR